MHHAHSTQEKSKIKLYGNGLVHFKNVRFKAVMAVCIKIMVSGVSLVKIDQNTRWHIPEVLLNAQLTSTNSDIGTNTSTPQSVLTFTV